MTDWGELMIEENTDLVQDILRRRIVIVVEIIRHPNGLELYIARQLQSRLHVDTYVVAPMFGLFGGLHIQDK